MQVVRMLVLGSLIGCGASATDVAQATLTTTSYAAVQADKSFADAYRLASEAARAESATLEEKQARMAEWDAAANRIELALRATYAGLAVAAVGLDAWKETGDASSWTAALCELADHLRELASVLKARGLSIPQPIEVLLEHVQGVGC